MNTTTDTTTKPRKRRRRRYDRTGLPMAGYVRVSTRGQAASGLGLDAQRDILARWATAEGMALDVHEDAGRSRAAGNLEHRGEGIAVGSGGAGHVRPPQRSADGEAHGHRSPR